MAWIIIISSKSRSARFAKTYRLVSISRFEPDPLRLFVRAYQRVQPLTIGELWAVAITLRIVLVENLRRAASRIVSGRAARQAADNMADRLLGLNGYAAEANAFAYLDTTGTSLAPAFAVQLVQPCRLELLLQRPMAGSRTTDMNRVTT
jgi:hypothetical protein